MLTISGMVCKNFLGVLPDMALFTLKHQFYVDF